MIVTLRESKEIFTFKRILLAPHLVNKKVVLAVGIKWSRFLDVESLPPVEDSLQGEPGLARIVHGVRVVVRNRSAVVVVKVIALWLLRRILVRLFLFVLVAVVRFLKILKSKV